MISFWRIFSLELTALSRTGTVWMLLVAAVAYVALLPHLVTGDGTAEGLRELVVRYSLGGVFAVTAVSLLSSATASIAAERAAKRLQLTAVRPVSAVAIAFAKYLAHAVTALCVMAAAGIALAFTVPDGGSCNHVHTPLLESVTSAAEREYARYMADTNTPDVIRQAEKSDIIRLLSRHVIDSYTAIATNGVQELSFPGAARADDVSVRLRFASTFGMRQDVCGEIHFGGHSAVVSNQTKTALTLRLAPHGGTAPKGVLRFVNRGESDVLLRLRRDIEVLVAADSFYANLVRACLVLSALVSLLCAFGLFLGAGLSRPVALFTASVVLITALLSPAVAGAYPDSIDASKSDRIGLSVSRAVEKLTGPVGSVDALAKLSVGDCVEYRDVAVSLLVDFLAYPLLFCVLAGFFITRKHD